MPRARFDDDRPIRRRTKAHNAKRQRTAILIAVIGGGVLLLGIVVVAVVMIQRTIVRKPTLLDLKIGSSVFAASSPEKVRSVRAVAAATPTAAVYTFIDAFARDDYRSHYDLLTNEDRGAADRDMEVERAAERAGDIVSRADKEKMSNRDVYDMVLRRKDVRDGLIGGWDGFMLTSADIGKVAVTGDEATVTLTRSDKASKTFTLKRQEGSWRICKTW